MPLLMCVINIPNLTKQAWSIKIYYMEFHTFMSCFFFSVLCLPVFVAKCTSTFLFSLFGMRVDVVFSFSSFIPTEKSQKIFLLPRKMFCERKLSCTRMDFREILLREQKGQSRAGSITPSWLRVGIPCVAHRIWFILLAHGASHIIKRTTIIFCFIFCCYSKEKLDSRTEWHSISVFKPSLQEKVNAYVRKGYACFLIVVAFLFCH